MKRTVIAILLLSLLVSVAYGATYRWNANKRPPVALPVALRRANTLLGDDARNRYCIGVDLNGNKDGDGKECFWSLYFAAADGSITLVRIDHTGEGSVEPFNGPTEWRVKPDRRSGLDDIAARLNGVLEAKGYEARATVKDSKLTLRARSRTFRVYPKTESGEFGDELVDVIGPKHDGVVIEAHELDHLDREAYEVFEQGPYWLVNRSNHLLTGDDRFVKVEMRYRAELPTSLFFSLRRAFGKEAPDPFR